MFTQKPLPCGRGFFLFKKRPGGKSPPGRLYFIQAPGCALGEGAGVGSGVGSGGLMTTRSLAM